MPAVSQSQRRFMAICEHEPQHAQGTCPNLPKSKLHDFASTPEKGLPKFRSKNLRKSMVSKGDY